MASLRDLSLSKAFALALAVTVIPLVVLLTVFVYQFQRSEALEHARREALVILQRNLAIHAYFAHSLKPPLLDDLSQRIEAGYFNPAWMSSTFAVREIDKEFHALHKSKYYYKECAINARSPENEADAVERDFIRAINADPDLTERVLTRSIDSERYLTVLYRGEALDAGCLRCHDTADRAPAGLVERYGPLRSFGREAGETVSAVSIRIPMQTLFANTVKNTAWLASLIFAILLAGFAILYAVTKRFALVPLDTLARQTAAISADESRLGEQLRVGGTMELRALTESFNAMSARLRRQIDQRDRRIEVGVSELYDTVRQLEQEVADKETLAALLRTSERTYRDMFDNAPLPYQSLDEKGVFLHVNQVWLRTLGYEAHEVVGAWFGDFLAPGFKEHFAKNFPMFKHACMIDDVEFEMLHKNGERLLVSFNGRIQTDENGDFVRTHWIFKDVTENRRLLRELKQAKDSAEEANEAKSRFLANMSHEMRTPLNGILGMLQLIQTTSLDEEQRDYSVAAIQSITRLNRLLTDILDLSRVEAGKLSVKQDPFDLREVLGQVRDLFAVTSKQTGVALRCDVEPSIPGPLLGDATRLQQVLNNLVGNAFKFTTSGRIAIEARLLPQGGDARRRVLFTVRDTGIGIPEEKLGMLFEPFTQANEGYARTSHGAGLGLSICHRLVSLMGGEIHVQSEEGQGTEFFFNLPFAQAEGFVRQDPAGAAPAEVILSGLRVLLAEDDKVSRMAARRLLEKSGCTVSTAENGILALETLAREPFDVVLMDVQMPGMDGVAATRALRGGQAGELNKGVPVVALTAYAMEGDREALLAAGMDEYLAKPVDIHSLTNALAELLRAPAGDA